MKITEQQNKVLIKFGNGMNRRMKISMAVAGFFYFVFTIGSARLLYWYVTRRVIGGELNPFGEHDSIGLSIILVLFAGGAMAFCSYAFIRFLKRVIAKENLLVAPDHLIISQIVSGKMKTRRCDIEGISLLSYRDGTGKNIYASLGVNTIRTLNAEGNIVLIYDGEPIGFGKDIYSWDADRINKIINKITKGRLNIDNIPEELSEDQYMDQ